MVRLGLARRDKFVANALRQRHIDKRITMDMPDLTIAKRELHAAKPMRAEADALPAGYFRLNLFPAPKTAISTSVSMFVNRTRYSRSYG